MINNQCNGWQKFILHKKPVGKIIRFDGLTLSSHSSVASLSLSKTDTGIVITGFSPRIRSPVLEFLYPGGKSSGWDRAPGYSFLVATIPIPLPAISWKFRWIQHYQDCNQAKHTVEKKSNWNTYIDWRRWWWTPWQDKQAQWASIEELCWKGNNLLLHWRLTPPDQENMF